jgi:hypothetical protein
MTALWEAAMRRISDGEMELGAFLQAVERQLEQLVASGRRLGVLVLPPQARAPSSHKSQSLRPRRRPKGRRTSDTVG